MVGYGFGDPGECVPAEAAAGFEDRHHHRERFAARTRFRAEAQFAEDHRPPERTFGGVVRRGNAGGVGEHEQTVAMVAQASAGFGGAAVGAEGAVGQRIHDSISQPTVVRVERRPHDLFAAQPIPMMDQFLAGLLQPAADRCRFAATVDHRLALFN